MNENNTAIELNGTSSDSPTPPPEPSPNLTVLPPSRTHGTRASVNTVLLGQLTLAAEICTAAQQPDYAAAVAAKGIATEFIAALMADVAVAGEKARLAVQSGSARKGAKAAELAAAEMLIASLRDLQQAARTQYLPEHPEKLTDYHVGQKLGRTPSLLKTYAEQIINTANVERPAGVDTEVIARVTADHQAFIEATTHKSGARGKGQQARAQLKAMVASINARRKKIQYAADRAFPPHQADGVEARTAFKLPQDRRYSA